MRAKATLAALCILTGAVLMHLPAEAAEPTSRTTQKHSRPVQAATTAAPRPATPAQLRQEAANRASTTRQAAATQRQAAQRPAAPATQQRAAQSARQSQEVRRLSTQIEPPRALQVASRGAMRPAYAMGAGSGMNGTAILPVAVTSGLSCVPFARMATGMTISGDARLWWYNAAGSYARGNAPERGSVLAFTASGGMSRGHVAVVSRVLDPRTIHIDHSNWGGPGIRRGTVMRGVAVMDVSDRNDWTAVRVQVGHDSSSFGRTYPTHGFIYNRPAGTRMMTAQAPGYLEVAQVAPAAAPDAAQHHRLATQLFGQ